MDKRIAVVSFAAALAACSSNGSNLSLSLKSTAVSADGGALDGGTGDAGVSQGVEIDRLRIVIASIKLEGPASDVDAGLLQKIEVSVGPFLVDVSGSSLDGGVQQVFDTSVPTGSYREFRIDIGPAKSGDLSVQGDSIIIDGTFNGAPFTFTSGLHVQEKKEGSFVVGTGSANITLQVDTSTWFGDPAHPLDPTVSANRDAIEDNIRASFKAFRDDDHDGKDDDDDNGDDDGHDGGDHGGGDGDGHGH
jgi:hypothetical protein